MGMALSLKKGFISSQKTFPIILRGNNLGAGDPSNPRDKRRLKLRVWGRLNLPGRGRPLLGQVTKGPWNPGARPPAG